MPLIGRRRPLMRAAMVGGAAYATGKHVQRKQQHEAEQDQALADTQQQQQYAQPEAYAPPPPPAPVAAAPPPPPPAPAAPRSASDRVAALTQLKDLLDAGVLTDEEFQTEKKKILQEG
jgi:putative oligomerization/nucleic acid binding protein